MQKITGLAWTAGMFGVFAILYLAIALIVGVFWDYTLNSWLTFFGKDTIAYWQAVVLALVPGIGQSGILAAVVTWILGLFLF